MSELMKKVYYNPSDPGSLGGKDRLKRGVLQEYGVVWRIRSDGLASCSGRVYITQNRTCQIQA